MIHLMPTNDSLEYKYFFMNLVFRINYIMLMKNGLE